MLDLVIIGAGPAGISAAFEAQKLGLDYLVLEKGLIAETVYHYPVGLTVFSTTNELELLPNTLTPARDKPTREELLSYYVRFALDHDLKIKTEEAVTSAVKTAEETFQIRTVKSAYEARRILFTTGAMAYPRKINVPGEDLSKVHHQFRETYPYVKKHALVIGGGNSAGEAALFLAQEGAISTLATFREDWESTDPKQGCIKHWVKEPLEEQLEKNCLRVFFLKSVAAIGERTVTLEAEDGELETIPNDVVFVLVGADADLSLLKSLGVETEQTKYGEIPVYTEETFETNVAGVYVAGHFTLARHIKEAIAVPKRIVPEIVKSLRRFNAAK